MPPEAPASAAAITPPLFLEVHRGPLEQPPWSAFMRRLRVETGSDYVNLTFRRRDAALNDLTTFSEGRPLSDALIARYFTDDFRGDPVPYHSLTPGRAYRLEDLIDPTRDAAAHFSRDFLHGVGIRHSRIMRIVEPEGYTAWLTITRHSQGDFGPCETTLLESVAEPLSLAVETFSALERSRRLKDDYETVLRRLNLAVLTLDVTGRILNRNEAAAELLEARALMRSDAEGLLVLGSSASRRRLATLLRQFADNPEAAPRTITISEEPRHEMLTAPVRDRPASGLHTPVLTVYLQADLAASDHVEGLTRLYGLTRSEAQLSLAIANGRSVAAAAAENGLTTESARTYLKRIYLKTGTSRQAELVRAILTSVLILP